MKTPEPRSAVEQLQELAHQLQQAIDDLLQYSELRPAAVVGNYHEWRATNPLAGTARTKALGLFHAFEDDLHLILSWHDPTSDQVHAFNSHQVFEIIDQHAHTQMANLDDARRAVGEYLSNCLRNLMDVYDRLDGASLVIPDTNVLINYPELEGYHLGLPKATVVFTPIVIRELEDLKRRKPNARKVIRRLKEYGDKEDILQGVAISEKVSVMALATEPKREGVLTDERTSLALPEPFPRERKRGVLPAWLDLDVPDDRFIASALEVRREHPKARIVVLSGDFNVLTKARQARLPAFDAEAFFEQNQN